jgi:putative component of toxin-antitoxin plasmid stabilization module
MYFVRRKQVIIVMPGGGSRATQAADIAKAKEVAARLEDEEKT